MDQVQRLTLASVIKGKVDRPQRVVLYGTEGVGKSTFAADAPSPIFLPTEAGTHHLDVARFPTVQTWAQVLDALDALEGDHDRKTLVIDTLDAMEPLVWAQTCKTRMSGDRRVDSIEDYGYAKGYVYAVDVWRELLARIDRLIERRGMSAILIAHAHLSTFKSPDTHDWSRYDLKLHSKASAAVREWADHVLFATTQVALSRPDGKGGRIKGVGLGERVIHTTASAAWSAKARGDVPATIPLSYEAWAHALRGIDPARATELRASIAVLLAGAPELAARVTAAVEKAGDEVAALVKIENHLRVEATKKASES